MKKRVMKKYIPYGQYCYGKNGYCKYRKYLGVKKLNRTNCDSANTCNEKCWTKPNNSCQERIYKCEYLNYIDYHEDSLLWDACKDCGEHERTKELYLFELSQGYCKRNKKFHI